MKYLVYVVLAALGFVSGNFFGESHTKAVYDANFIAYTNVANTVQLPTGDKLTCEMEGVASKFQPYATETFVCESMGGVVTVLIPHIKGK